MKYIPILCLLLCSCVTGDDMRAVAGRLDAFEAVLNDETATVAEVKAAQAEAAQGIREIATTVEERTTGVINGMGQGAEGGLIGIGAAIALNLYRNNTRKKDLAKVKQA